jgi:hypothetical protein
MSISANSKLFEPVKQLRLPSLVDNSQNEVELLVFALQLSETIKQSTNDGLSFESHSIVLLFLGLQRKSPHPNVVRISQRENKTLLTDINVFVWSL